MRSLFQRLFKLAYINDKKTLKDTLWLFSASVLTFYLLIKYDAASAYQVFAARFPTYHLDQIPLGLGICGLFLLVFTYRRLQDLDERMLQANTDALIGIFNRRKGTELICQAMRQANLHRVPLSLIMIDIDNFKAINDSHGHDSGDSVLKTVIDLAKSKSRRSDILVRWGGEEFVIACTNCELTPAANLAERIRSAIADARIDEVGKVTASFGVTEYCLCESFDSFVSRTDAQLYASKHGGKNRVSIDESCDGAVIH